MAGAEGVLVVATLLEGVVEANMLADRCRQLLEFVTFIS